MRETNDMRTTLEIKSEVDFLVYYFIRKYLYIIKYIIKFATNSRNPYRINIYLYDPRVEKIKTSSFGSIQKHHTICSYDIIIRREYYLRFSRRVMATIETTKRRVITAAVISQNALISLFS